MRWMIPMVMMLVVSGASLLGWWTGCGDDAAPAPDGLAETDVVGDDVPVPPPPAFTGAFIDAPVEGLGWWRGPRVAPTATGLTDATGTFGYDLAGEPVTFAIGGVPIGWAPAAPTISPADLTPARTAVAAIGRARLLQSLDEDGVALNGIRISEVAAGLLAGVLFDFGMAEVDFDDAQRVGEVIAELTRRARECHGLSLQAIDAATAEAQLKLGVGQPGDVRANVSGAPGSATDIGESTTPLIQLLGVEVPAARADGTLTRVTVRRADGTEEVRTQVRPLMAAWLEEVDGAPTHFNIPASRVTRGLDQWVAISRDDGRTWARTNVSRMAAEVATRTGGRDFPGTTVIGGFAVAGGRVLVAFGSRMCSGGAPRYALGATEPGYSEDLWGVGGTQGQVDYALGSTSGGPGGGAGGGSGGGAGGDSGAGSGGDASGADGGADGGHTTDSMHSDAGSASDVGGDTDVTGGAGGGLVPDPKDVGVVPFACVWTVRGRMESDGTMTWYQPERLTSGVRDAFQVTPAAVPGVGFALVWQEDPGGLRPGQGLGPGEGWSGSTVHHRTDLWYASLPWADFDGAVAGQADGERPRPAVPFTLPVRVTDNEPCNRQNMQLDGAAGDPSAGSGERGRHLWCQRFQERLCVAFEARQTPGGGTVDVCVTADGRRLDGRVGASRPQLALERYAREDGTASAWVILAYEETKGLGAGPDGTAMDIGKVIFLDSFDFLAPATISRGGLIPLPARDDAGNPLRLPDGSYDHEVNRRVRLMTQRPDEAGPAGLIAAVVWKGGRTGQGEAADTLMRRIFASDAAGNPYASSRLECSERDTGGTCLRGALNLSSVSIAEKIGERATRWRQTADNLQDFSFENPGDNAKAHRGFIRGDRVVVVYTWTANAQTPGVGSEKYDLYVRRSFDGGATWTTNPAASAPTDRCEVFVDPAATDPGAAVEVCEAIAPGDFEPARNVTRLLTHRVNASDPRILPIPEAFEGADGVPDGDRFWLGYNTEVNTGFVGHATGGFPEGLASPLDVFWSVTRDAGQTWLEAPHADPDTGRVVRRFPLLWAGAEPQGGLSLAPTPDGSRCHTLTTNGVDAIFRGLGFTP